MSDACACVAEYVEVTSDYDLSMIGLEAIYADTNLLTLSTSSQLEELQRKLEE
jgi:hypothetical protein